MDDLMMTDNIVKDYNDIQFGNLDMQQNFYEKDYNEDNLLSSFLNIFVIITLVLGISIFYLMNLITENFLTQTEKEKRDCYVNKIKVHIVKKHIKKSFCIYRRVDDILLRDMNEYLNFKNEIKYILDLYIEDLDIPNNINVSKTLEYIQNNGNLNMDELFGKLPRVIYEIEFSYKKDNEVITRSFLNIEKITHIFHFLNDFEINLYSLGYLLNDYVINFKNSMSTTRTLKMQKQYKKLENRFKNEKLTVNVDGNLFDLSEKVNFFELIQQKEDLEIDMNVIYFLMKNFLDLEPENCEITHLNYENKEYNIRQMAILNENEVMNISNYCELYDDEDNEDDEENQDNVKNEGKFRYKPYIKILDRPTTEDEISFRNILINYFLKINNEMFVNSQIREEGRVEEH